MIEIKSKRKIDLWLSIFIVTVIILLAGITYITGDLSTYMATPIAISNDGIFTNDFSVMEFMRPNAQSISDNIMALFLRLGISWQALSVIGYIITAAVFASGIIAISKRLAPERYYIIAGVLMFFSFYALSGLRIGRNPIWYPSFYYAQAAFCIAVWGFVKALDKKWYFAFILFAIATLIHFTAGSYCAVFALIFLIIHAVKNKKYKLLYAPLIWVAGCFTIFGIMYFSGTTGSGLLSNDAFVKIHAYLRHPHHHVPSSWEKIEWINYICYIGAVFLILRYSAKDDALYKKINSFFLYTTALMFGILIINYLFVEIIPIAVIAKLQPARSVFVYRFFLAAILAYCIYILINKKEYLQASLIILMTALPQINIKTYSGILLLLVALYLLVVRLSEKKNIISLKVIMHIAVIILILAVIALYSSNIAVLVRVFYIFAFMILLAFVVLTDMLKDKKGEAVFIKIVTLLAALVIILIPLIDVRGNFESVGFKSAKAAFTLSGVDFDAQQLAYRFNEETEKNALFLGDPNDITTSYFRMFSLRSTVVTFKNMPFTDKGMITWIDRLKSLKAIKVKENGFYIRNRKSFNELSADEIINIAKTYDAEYILVNFDEEKLFEFYSLGAKEFDSKGKWTIIIIGIIP